MIGPYRTLAVLVLTTLVPSVIHLSPYATAAGVQTVLTFDDLQLHIQDVQIPNGYGSVSWPDNMGIYAPPEPPYLPQTPPNRVLFNLNDETGVSESVVSFIGGPKIFVGAYFSGFSDVQLAMYRQDTLAGFSSVLVLGIAGSGPTFLASDYAGLVDRVGIIGDRGSFIMDDFTFEEVPEPASACLIGLGAICVVGRRSARPRI